jgi:regulator of protease activity HflC (stomatin/prohibitin superfamily)
MTKNNIIKIKPIGYILMIIGIVLVVSSIFIGSIMFGIGLLIGIVGIVIVIASIGDEFEAIGFAIFTLVLLCVSGGIVVSSLQTVSAGEVKIVINSPAEELKGEVLTNGWHFDTRFVMSNIDTMRFNNQITEFIGKDSMDDLDGSVMVMSSDQLYIFIDLSVTYNITESECAKLRFTYGEDWKVSIIYQALRSVPRTICASYTALDIVGVNRTTVEQAITEGITDALETKGGLVTGVNVVDVKIREMRIPDGLAKAVEQRIIAEQLLEKSKVDLERIKVEADAEAKRKVIDATADADVIAIKAQANADAINKVLLEFVDSGGKVDIQAYLAYLYIQALTDPNSNITYVIVPSDGGYIVVPTPTG